VQKGRATDFIRGGFPRWVGANSRFGLSPTKLGAALLARKKRAYHLKKATERLEAVEARLAAIDAEIEKLQGEDA